MTAKQPQEKMYLISKSELDRATSEIVSANELTKIWKAVLSRPAPQPTGCPYWKQAGGDFCNCVMAYKTISPAPQPDAPKFKPDWISPPGATIGNLMQELGISRLQMCSRLQISGKALTSLLSGEFVIDDDMAYRLYEVFGSLPQFWIERERIYREQLRQQQGGKKE